MSRSTRFPLPFRPGWLISSRMIVPSRLRHGLLLSATLFLFAIPLAAGGSQEEAPPQTTGPDQLPQAVQDALKKMQVLPFVDPVHSLDFSLEDAYGSLIKLHSQKLVMLNFWATWCVPCRSEMPSMQALYEELGPEGLEIIAVNQLEGRDLVSSFMQEYGLSFPAPMDESGRISYQWAVRSIPTTYIVLPGGRIIGGKIGAQEWNGPQVLEAWRDLLTFYDIKG